MTKRGRPTAAQMRVLENLRDGNVMFWTEAQWRSGRHVFRRTTIEAMTEAHWLEWIGPKALAITDTGRSMLDIVRREQQKERGV